MSNMVRQTNISVNQVINTLEMSKSQPNMESNQNNFDDPIDIDGTNAQDLLA